MLRRCAVALVALALESLCAVDPEELTWPEYLAPPDEEMVPDSSGLHAGLRQDIYGSTFESKDTLHWSLIDSTYALVQNARYGLIRRYDAREQWLDLSGRYSRTARQSRVGSTYGLEWVPLLNLKQRDRGNGWFQSTVDLGGRWESDPIGIPLMLRGGFSARGWNDSVPDDLVRTEFDDFHGSPGFYGGLSVGGSRRLVERIPMYLNASVFGRYVEDAGLALARGTVLYGQGIASGDSMFVYIADSLSDGRESYLAEGQGSTTRSIDSPWRIENSLRAAVAFKGATSLHVTPSLSYRLRQAFVTYPEDNRNLLNDVSNTDHVFTILAQTDDKLFFRYRGGVTFVLGNEDWLFRQDVSREVAGENLDSLRRNNEDYQGSGAAMVHAVEVPMRNGAKISYSYLIDRRSRRYVNECRDSSVMVFDDNDRQRQLHEAGVTILETQSWKAGVSGRYVREVLNYTKGQRSSNNKTDHGYQLQAVAVYTRGDRLLIGEVLTAESNMAEYKYTRDNDGGYIHQGSENAPPFSRRFVSVLSGKLSLGERWALSGKWNETYWDDGAWYGSEYFGSYANTSADRPERTDYYAIERKSTEYRVELGISCAPRESFSFEVGSALQDIFQREYDGEKYETRHYGQGYLLEPYIKLAGTILGRIDVRGQIKRTVNTYDEDIWDVRRNWDMKLYVGASF